MMGVEGKMGRRIARRGRGARPRGFTMLEAMMTILVLIIAIMGMGSLAASSVRANNDAQDYTRAMYVAEQIGAWLQTETAGWNNLDWNPAVNEVPSTADQMPLLSRMDKNNSTNGVGWQLVSQNLPTGGNEGFTPYFSLNELTLPTGPAETAGRYCAYYNLTWLLHYEVMRADIRVFWAKRPAAAPIVCENGSFAALNADRQTVRSVSHTVYLSRHDLGGEL